MLRYVWVAEQITSAKSSTADTYGTLYQLACVKLWSLCQSLDNEDARKEALELQNLISLADGIALRVGVSHGSELRGKEASWLISI